MSGRAAPLVVGGGPAGSMFALTLADAGHDVTLLEKSTAPHDKVCGDFLSHETGLYLQRHALHPHSLGAVAIRTVRLVTPWFKRESPLPFPAWSLTRRCLDEALLEQAGRRGVQVVRGAHVSSLERRGGDWSAALRDGTTFQTDTAVLASGKLDLGGHPRPKGSQPHLLAFKMYYRMAQDRLRALGDAVELVLFPGGYAGLQPVEGGAVNLCLLVDSRRLPSGAKGAAALQQIVEHTPALRERLRGAVALLPRPLALSNIPYGHLHSGTTGGLWRIGDQAAVIPSFCGDGTAIALHSGALAARCFLRGEPAEVYQHELRSQLATRMWAATRLSQLLVQLPLASHLVRAFPGLVQRIATLTRIPEDALGRDWAEARGEL